MTGLTAALSRLIALDEALSARLAIPRNTPWRLPVLLLAHSGDSLLWVLLAAVALIWGDDRWRAVGGRVLLGTVAAGVVTTALKRLFRRRRPPGEGRGFYTHFDRHAFPSGHAGRSACLVLLLLPFVPAELAPLPFLWAGLVGLARVALQVHFVTDILGGWAVGALVGWGCLALLPR